MTNYPAVYDSSTKSAPNPNAVAVTDEILTPLGYAQLTSLAAAASLTVPAGATIAVFIAEAQGVRFRDDGTAPTATVGMPLATGEPFEYKGNLAAIEFIAQFSGAILNVSFYK